MISIKNNLGSLAYSPRTGAPLSPGLKKNTHHRWEENAVYVTPVAKFINLLSGLGVFCSLPSSLLPFPLFAALRWRLGWFPDQFPNLSVNWILWSRSCFGVLWQCFTRYDTFKAQRNEKIPQRWLHRRHVRQLVSLNKYHSIIPSIHLLPFIKTKVLHKAFKLYINTPEIYLSTSSLDLKI